MANESVVEYLDLIKENWHEAWQKTEPEVVQFLKIGEQLQSSIQKEVEKNNILEGDFKVLFRLRACGIDNPQSPTSLYTNIGITSGGLTKILHRLKLAGHIIRVPNPDDRRSTLVQLSQKGMELTEEVFDGVVKRDTKYLSILSDEERETIKTICDKLLR